MSPHASMFTKIWGANENTPNKLIYTVRHLVFGVYNTMIIDILHPGPLGQGQGKINCLVCSQNASGKHV